MKKVWLSRNPLRVWGEFVYIFLRFLRELKSMTWERIVARISAGNLVIRE